MKCPTCGEINVQNSNFCVKCGKYISNSGVLFCQGCGAMLDIGNQFCNKCGRPASAASDRLAPARKSRKAGRAVGIAAAVIVPVGLAVLVGIALLVVLLLLPGLGKEKRLNLGNTRLIGSATITASGGKITINDATSVIDGLSIQVPEFAYKSDTQFNISETEIKGHNFGDAFVPASPLITVDNGHGFAAEPMEVTIPISKQDNEFAMAFFYDRGTGELEGMPLISESNSSITVMTQHFSEFVISKVKKGRIIDDVDSGFRPGTNDFQMPNYGSIIAKGHCAGQSIAAMYYYYNRQRIGWYTPLFGRFDNNGGIKTPAFWQDDAREIRLCSALQNAMSANWSGGQQELGQYFRLIGADDELTYYAIAYAIQITGKPQFVYICQSAGEKGAHALIAYRVTADSIYVSDPNKPADKNRRIVFERSIGATPVLKPYGSGLNAEVMAKGEQAYDKFGYFGVFALVDKDIISRYWSEVIDGKLVAESLFPADVAVDVAVDLGSNGSAITKPLADGLVVTAEGTGKFGEGMEGMFCYRIPGQSANVRVSLYIGTSLIGECTGKWGKVALLAGSNDIGVLQEELGPDNEYHFVNFRRFNVIYSTTGPTQTSEQTAKPTATTNKETGGFAGMWSDALVKTETGGRVPLKCIQDVLVISINPGQSTVFSHAVVLNGGKYAVSQVFDTYNVNTVEVDGNSIKIVRKNSHTGSTIVFSGTLSASGDTINGTFVLTFGSDSSNYYKGTWKSTRIQ